MNAADLNQRYAVEGALTFVDGTGGMPHARLVVGPASAEVALHGGHVVAYGEEGSPPVLWLSRQAVFAPGKAIRGGIPVCWPWFGPHPSDLARPAHGFARNRMWTATGSGREGDRVWLSLALRDDEATLALWPHPFTLELTLSLGKRLDVALTMRNTGDGPLSCGGALHSYFTVGDVTRARIIGLEGRAYLDQLTGLRHTQAGPVTIAAEVDRVYSDDGSSCAIEDEVLGRRITVTKVGSRTTVVWNPWAEKARRLADFADDEYPGMLCVETAMALDDSVTLGPGETHTLCAAIASERLQ